MLESDITINVAKLKPEAIPAQQLHVNDYVTDVFDKGPKWFEVGAAKYREMDARGEGITPPQPLLDGLEDITIPSREPGRDIPCRMILPKDGAKPKATFVHFHGGGWVLGSEHSSDPLLAFLSEAAQLAVVSVGYRLAPEHPFPAGPEDCYDAAEWLVEHAVELTGAPLKFAGGESAGGHLAASTAFYLLDKKPEFAFAGLLLTFGAYDLSLLPQARDFRRTLVLYTKGMMEFVKAFIPSYTAEKAKDPAISPYYADMSKLTLPPALFTCGTADALLDDTVTMAVKWQMNQGEAITKLYPGAPHGFVFFPPEMCPAVGEWRDHVTEFLSGNLDR